MLTLFAVPKPFQDHIATIQRNAILSWTMLHPRPEIILFGDDYGIAEIAEELQLRHASQVESNSYGTPLISDVFRKAQNLASNHLLCYVNADIILMQDFVEGVQVVASAGMHFLMGGQRWNLEIMHPLDFKEGWQERLRSEVTAKGQLGGEAAMDYFVFTEGVVGQMPPFAVGRPAWDNWLIFHSRASQHPVIDASQAIQIVHQAHRYAHVPQRSGGKWEGPEAEENLRLAGGYHHLFTLADADFLLTREGLKKPKWTKSRVLRYLYSLTVIPPNPGIWLRIGRILLAHRNPEDYPSLRRFFRKAV